jgi:hypothetical protein
MPTIDPEKLDPLIATLLVDIRDRLERATAVAKGAVACAEAGDPQAGLQMALDIEQSVYEVNILLNAASLLNCRYRE